MTLVRVKMIMLHSLAKPGLYFSKCTRSRRKLLRVHHSPTKGIPRLHYVFVNDIC